MAEAEYTKNNGIIELDSKLGKELGFTSNLFEGYLFQVDNAIYISFIISKEEGKGNLTRLFDKILEKEYKIKVPTPLGKMEKIVKAKGFEKGFEKDFEVWEK